MVAFFSVASTFLPDTFLGPWGSPPPVLARGSGLRLLPSTSAGPALTSPWRINPGLDTRCDNQVPAVLDS